MINLDVVAVVHIPAGIHHLATIHRQASLVVHRDRTGADVPGQVAAVVALIDVVAHRHGPGPLAGGDTVALHHHAAVGGIGLLDADLPHLGHRLLGHHLVAATHTDLLAVQIDVFVGDVFGAGLTFGGYLIVRGALILTVHRLSLIVDLFLYHLGHHRLHLQMGMGGLGELLYVLRDDGYGVQTLHNLHRLHKLGTLVGVGGIIVCRRQQIVQHRGDVGDVGHSAHAGAVHVQAAGLGDGVAALPQDGVAHLSLG